MSARGENRKIACTRIGVNAIIAYVRDCAAFDFINVSVYYTTSITELCFGGWLAQHLLAKKSYS